MRIRLRRKTAFYRPRFSLSFQHLLEVDWIRLDQQPLPAQHLLEVEGVGPRVAVQCSCLNEEAVCLGGEGVELFACVT